MTRDISTDKYNNEKYFKFIMEFDEQMDEASVENIENYDLSATVGNVLTYYSKDIEIDIGADYAFDGMTIFYAVTTNPSTILTPYQVMNASRTYATVFGNESISEISQAIQFDANKTGGANARFTTGQRIHLVVKDSYGNVSNVVSQVIVREN